MDKIVTDTSVILNEQLASQIESGSVRPPTEIIIPQAVLDELQAQASLGRGQGAAGLRNAARLREISEQSGLSVSVRGDHVLPSDIELAGSGRIDALITDVARSCEAVLYTSDSTQHLAARSQGVDTVFLTAPRSEHDNLDFLKFFDADTMSVHLKEGHRPLAKRGGPGAYTLVEIPSELLERRDLELISSQIIGAVNATEQSTIEISKEGALVVQHKDYRIAITRPPFSESLEVTIVHPIVQMSIHDYDVSETLMKRLEQKAEGIVIAGPPGSGKSTLASGLGNFYHQKGRVVKTFESPRDLQVDSGVTQYGKLDGSFENTADILLLVRPDYTIFDEVRRREDFEVFADLRMTGVGMVGVVHANSPIDAIQRFIGKIELGMIPSILDTVIFVRAGRIDAVYDLALEVKVPSGMTESDLARPVIVVRDFESGGAVYEVYTFGEENVIVPVSSGGKKGGAEDRGVYKLAAERVLDTIRRYDRRATAEFVSDNRVCITVSKRHKARIIGKGGSHVSQLESDLGVRLDVRTAEEAKQRHGRGGGDGDDTGDEAGYMQKGTRGKGRPNRYYDYEDGHDDALYDQNGAGHDLGYGGGGDDGGDNGRSWGVRNDGDAAETSGGSPVPFSIRNNRNLIYIDVGREHQSKNVAILSTDGRQVATGRTNKRGTVKISTRAPGGRAILDMESPARELAVQLLE